MPLTPGVRRAGKPAGDGAAASPSGPDPGAVERRVCAGTAAICSLVLYTVTLCPTVPPGDGGELITASRYLGLAHPPGYPFYTALGWLMMLPGLVEPALAMNFLSALAGAAACGALAWLLHRATGSRTAAWAGALAFAASSTMWASSTVTEVYTLHLFLVVLLLAASHVAGTTADERSRGRALMFAGLILGIGLAHHPTIVLALPPAVLLAWPAGAHGKSGRGRPRGRSSARPLMLGALAALLVPLLAYSWLLLRARHQPEVNWGHRRTVDQLWQHISAIDYRRYDLGWAGLLRPERWRWLGSHLLGELTPIALPFALLGLVSPRFGPTGRRLAWAALLLAALHVLFGLRYSVEDADVFLIPAWLGLAVAAGLGVARLESGTWPRARLGAGAAAVILIAAPAVAHFRACNLHGVTAAADFGRDLLASVGRDDALMVESDQAFPVFYLTYVLHERPDVKVFGRWGVLGRDPAAEVAHLPGGAALAANDMHTELALIDLLVGSGRCKAFHFLANPGYPVPPRYRMEPSALTWRVVLADTPPAEESGFWDRSHETRVLIQAERLQDRYLIGLAADYPLLRGASAAALGQGDRARAAFDKAARIAGDQDAMTHMRLGILEATLLRDPARAVRSFEHAVALQPRSVESWNNLARARRFAGDREGSRQAYQHALELSPADAEARSALGEPGRPGIR